MEDCELNDREFKIVVMKKIHRDKENSEIQFNKLRNRINNNNKGVLYQID